jgi:hypothetical protein
MVESTESRETCDHASIQSLSHTAKVDIILSKQRVVMALMLIAEKKKVFIMVI